jgi:hypothetical protein
LFKHTDYLVLTFNNLISKLGSGSLTWKNVDGDLERLSGSGDFETWNNMVLETLRLGIICVARVCGILSFQTLL